MNKKYYIYTMPTDNVIYMYLLNISIECIYMYLTSLYICYLYQSIFDSLLYDVCIHFFMALLIMSEILEITWWFGNAIYL